MTSAVSGGKKPALCRYFMNTGSCVYGDDCQFLHQSPPGLQKPFTNGPMPHPENQGLSDIMGSDGDQFFNATFNTEGPMPEFQPFSRQRPLSRSQRNMMNTMNPPPPMSSNGGKPFMHAGPRMDQNMANDFAALNLSVPVSAKGPAPVINEFIPKQASEFIPKPVNEFIPKSASLSHSSSTPSFSTYSVNMNGTDPMSGVGLPTSHGILGPSHLATPPSHNIGTVPSHIPTPTTMALSTSASPNHSPGMSPTNSPLMMRRTGSPVTPLRQTTMPSKGSTNTIQENVGGTTYFYSPEDFTPQHEGVVLPNFSMYPSVPTHIAHMKVKANMPQFFMPDELKMELLTRHALTMAQIDVAQNPDIPNEVDNYHNLFPLEPPPANPLAKSNTFSYPTMCYKAVNSKDGLTYCLRRINGFRLVNTKCMAVIDMWKKMYHPNIVQLKEVFTTKAFGDHSIVFVYDYHPGGETLMSRHFNSPPPLNGYNTPFSMDGSARPFSAGKGVTGPRQHAGLLPESLIWAYVVQLSSSLRAIHAAGLACRSMDPTKILIYSKSRLKLNCVGIFDVLTFDANQANPLGLMPHYQQDDLVSLGKVVLALACNSVMGIQRENLQTSMELVARNYSADLKNLILYLLTNQTRPRSVNDIMPMIGARFYTQLDAAQLRSDVLENELAKEVENGRLYRLICKLGIMNERPELNMDPQWSETGDRYMLKLFRDYLFHQVDENGAPWTDMAHIVQCLNKLDAGISEKICLMSRDEQSVLVVSYAELKQCFENAFNGLMAPSGQQTGFT